jgi:hypothetical protein
MINTLTYEQYEAVKKAICPGCAHDLSDIRDCTRETWYHVLSGTNFKMDCRANEFRGKYYRACRANKPDGA